MCCETLLNLIEGVFTIYFAIVGLALTTYGAFSTYTLLIINGENTIREHLTIVPSLATVILGILLIIVVFLGCCAVCREVSCCLETYSVFLILLSLVHLGLGAYCLITFSSVETSFALKSKIYRDVSDAVENYRNSPSTMDGIQDWLKCCGYENASNEYSFYGSELPPSCCEDQITCLQYSPARYKEGCAKQVFIFTLGTNYYLGWISVIVGITELIASLLGISLSCCIWRKQVSSW